MNYQKIDFNSDQVKEASEILDIPSEMLTYFAWPQTFGSTTGPFPGIGGQAMSTFTIEAYSDGRDAVLFCKGKFIRRINLFDPCKAVMGKYR